MTTSATYTFAPGIGEIGLNALSRIQIRPPAITQDHMIAMRMEGNLLQAQWSNQGVTLWSVDLQTMPLVQGTATYSVPANTVMILDAYISTGSPPTNRYISPFSRTDFASLGNPTSQGFSTVFWFDRLIAPTITLWPVPDGSGPYTLSYWRYRQIQDAEYANGGNAEIPYLFLDAWAAGLAHRLSRHYAPSLEQLRKADAVEAFQIASAQNTENVPMYISPQIGNYYP